MIKPVTKQDRETYLALVKEFYDSGATLIHPDKTAWENTFRELMRSTDYAECFLMWEGTSPAGFALVAKTYSQEVGGMVLWLEELYVRPAFRGRGLGHTMLDYLDERYGGSVKRFRLETEEENVGSIRLYQRHGYQRFAYIQMKKDL